MACRCRVLVYGVPFSLSLPDGKGGGVPLTERQDRPSAPIGAREKTTVHCVKGLRRPGDGAAFRGEAACRGVAPLLLSFDDGHRRAEPRFARPFPQAPARRGLFFIRPSGGLPGPAAHRRGTIALAFRPPRGVQGGRRTAPAFAGWILLGAWEKWTTLAVAANLTLPDFPRFRPPLGRPS